jgi:hypothetical protein
MSDYFLDKGYFSSLAPTLTGDWEKDKREFKEIYTLLYKSFMGEEEDEEEEVF